MKEPKVILWQQFLAVRVLDIIRIWNKNLTHGYDEIEPFIFRYFKEKILISDKILADRPENFNFQK